LGLRKTALPIDPRVAQNAGRMFALLRSRPLIWIALFAWLAQLALPSAHAAAMARHDAGISGWCGKFSPAMAAKVATLPDEIRDIIAPGADEHAAMQAECLLLCAGTLGAAMPAGAVATVPTSVFVTEAPLALADPHRDSRSALRPPPRGPPTTR
jgi:hypothetical protein